MTGGKVEWNRKRATQVNEAVTHIHTVKCTSHTVKPHTDMYTYVAYLQYSTVSLSLCIYSMAPVISTHLIQALLTSKVHIQYRCGD